VNQSAGLARAFKAPEIARGEARAAIALVATRQGSGVRLTLLTRARLGVALAVSTLALLFAMPASALATTGHSFAGQFGSPGNEDGQLAPGGPSAIALDQSSGDVFLADPGHTLNGDGVTLAPRIERFDASGAYESSFSIDSATYGSPGALAIDPAGSGSIYVAATELASGAGVVLKYSAAGVFAHALDASTSGTTINAAAPVAVDPTDGTVYTVATETASGAQVIDSFDGATGVFVSSFNGAGSPNGVLFCPSSLAVDGAHRLYVVDFALFGSGYVDQYSTAGVFGREVVDNSAASAVAVTADPVSNEVFVGESSYIGAPPLIQAYTAGGTAPGQTFGPPSIGSFAGLAVNSSAGTVDVADNTNTTVERFTAFTGPTVATSGGTAIDPTSASLTGTINPGDVSSTYQFEYGIDTNYGSSTEESDPVMGATEQPATSTATGLLPNTTYHFRIVGKNASGSITGGDQMFTTPAAPPTLDGSPGFASDIAATSATFNGTLNPNASDTTYHFEYGTDTNYGSSTPDADAGAGSGDQPVTADLTGLTGGTTYHYRLVADNGIGGEQDGTDVVFTTAPATPASASDVTVFGADLHGTINPHGAATTYHFEYGTDTSYGRSTPETDGGSGDGDELVTESTGRLTPGTTYHFRVVATTNGQTVSSDDHTFTSGALPVAVASEPTGITTAQATLGGTIDTHGVAGTYRFQVSSMGGTYSSTTESLPTPSGEGPQVVSAALSGLPPGESFLVVLSVTSNQATVASDQVVFSTAAPQVPPGRPAIAGGPYGCNAPAIDPYNAHPRGDETIRIAGRDLGVGGNVTLGGVAITPSNWSAGGFSIEVPHNASGTLPLTVNCGHVSNTVAVTIFHLPSSTFTITDTTVRSGTATFSVKVPGAGKLATSGKNTASETTTVTKAGTANVTVRLSNAGRKALRHAKHHVLKVSVLVTYTPAGGTSARHSRMLTFKAGSKR
jgi:hypothetical protein